MRGPSAFRLGGFVWPPAFSPGICSLPHFASPLHILGWVARPDWYTTMNSLDQIHVTVWTRVFTWSANQVQVASACQNFGPKGQFPVLRPLHSDHRRRPEWHAKTPYFLKRCEEKHCWVGKFFLFKTVSVTEIFFVNRSRWPLPCVDPCRTGEI